MSIDIDKLERLAKAATPGPWRVEVRTLKGFGFCLVASGAPYHSGQVAHYCLSSDAVFVASANPATVLELIGEVRRLRAELAAAQAREVALRVALAWIGGRVNCLIGQPGMPPEASRVVPHVRAALDQPTDDTALRQAIRLAKEEMRERAAKVCEDLVTPTRLGGDPGRAWITGTFDCAEAIRALDVE